jgi:hypothetical protein
MLLVSYSVYLHANIKVYNIEVGGSYNFVCSDISRYYLSIERARE